VKIYLAARYSRRLELCGYREQLRTRDIVITSRWLDGSHQLSDDGTPIGDDGEALVEDGDSARAVELREKFALDDFDDVLDAQALVAFTEPPRSNASRGGRHVEFGIALGLAIPVSIVGPRENVFGWLPGVAQYETWEQYLKEGLNLDDFSRNG
jgi:hypothetical protein